MMSTFRIQELVTISSVSEVFVRGVVSRNCRDVYFGVAVVSFSWQEAGCSLVELDVGESRAIHSLDLEQNPQMRVSVIQVCAFACMFVCM